MIDKWLIVGGAHFAVAAVVLKLLGVVLPCCVTSYYSGIGNLILYVYIARFTFELTKKWYLNEKLQPENRAVFITASDTGFGCDLAQRLDSNGFPVFAGCIDPDSSGATELKKNCSKRLQVVQIDVTKDRSVIDAVDFVKENLGTSELWALVNNAETQRGFDVELTSMEEFRETMEVNGLGPVRVTKEFLPLLRQSKGRVINLTNPAGKLALPYLTPYTMSKFAAMAFNECLKQELDVWGIRVISVEPVFSQDGLANPNVMKTNLGSTFSTLDPNVKDDYGDKYLKSFKVFADFLCTSSPPRTDAVIEATENAISMKYPKSEYKPSKNILFQIIFYVLERGPSLLTHTIGKLLLFVLGFPRPKEAENYL